MRAKAPTRCSRTRASDSCGNRHCRPPIKLALTQSGNSTSLETLQLRVSHSLRININQLVQAHANSCPHVKFPFSHSHHRRSYMYGDACNRSDYLVVALRCNSRSVREYWQSCCCARRANGKFCTVDRYRFDPVSYTHLTLP